MLVNGTSGSGRDLALLFRLFLNLSNLLSLLRGGADLHAKDNVTNLTLSQRCNIHTAREGGDDIIMTS